MCGSPPVLRIVSSSNRNGNAGRQYLYCPPCRFWICWVDSEGILPQNPLCFCGFRSRLNNRNDGVQFYSCATKHCKYFDTHIGDANKIWTNTNSSDIASIRSSSLEDFLKDLGNCGHIDSNLAIKFDCDIRAVLKDVERLDLPSRMSFLENHLVIISNKAMQVRSARWPKLKALTCLEYSTRRWGAAGERILRAISQLYCSNSGSTTVLGKVAKPTHQDVSHTLISGRIRA